MRSHEPFQGQPLLLNLKKVTGSLLKELARWFAVPDTDSFDELWQSIKEKLSEMGCEPRTMQVCLQGTTCGTRITLQDAEGIFLDLEPGERERDLPNEGHNEVT